MAPRDPLPKRPRPPSDPWDTPAMRQYRAFKDQQPGCLLFFRMGDFYELFGDDALAAGPALGLAVTTRGNGIPIAGVPHHQRDRYLAKAMAAGYRVVVADQVQDPKDAKGVVERAITQIITPGTLVDEALLPDESPVSVAAVALSPLSPHAAAAAIVELSTGRFTLWSGPIADLEHPLAREAVREIIHPAESGDPAPQAVADLAARLGLALTPRAPWTFAHAEALAVLLEQFAVATLEGFGLAHDDPAVPPAGAVVAYLRETQSVGRPTSLAASGHEFQRLASTLDHLRPPRRQDPTNLCVLDAVSLRALEIERTIRADTLAPQHQGPSTPGLRGSLLGVFLDAPTGPRCVLKTPMGKRLIRRWLTAPLAAAKPIRQRQEAVATLRADRRLAGELAAQLAPVQDVERIAARLALGRVTPRDLVALGGSIARAHDLALLTDACPPLATHHHRFAHLELALGPLAARIARTCVDDPPGHLREGGLIRPGVDPELDEARSTQRDADAWMIDYQQRLIAEHDLPSLKVGFNSVFGFYIELPAAQSRRAPVAFTRKQTLKNAERYITPELKLFEERFTTAQSRAVAREQALFAELAAHAASHAQPLAEFADAVAELDTLAALAEKSAHSGWVRPDITDDPVLDIRQGRHPVLDSLLGTRFVPNDTALGHSHPHLALITGPNMAGKSTAIRQAALLTILASIGSDLPAQSALVGTADRIFTRVGADDALHRGQSTFMVEMTETAAILNNATPRSLVVLDEIGRGTGTLDGLALAWAIAESLAGAGNAPGPRTLFATHYHELTHLELALPGRVRNLTVQVREWEDQIVFLHRIAPGRAAGSYGVHVARLAGVPPRVADRAQALMASLRVHTDLHDLAPLAPLQPDQPDLHDQPDASDHGPPRRHAAHRAQTHPTAASPRPHPAGQDHQLPLFTEFLPHPALDRLRELKLEAMTPIQAFDALRDLVDSVNTPAPAPRNPDRPPA